MSQPLTGVVRRRLPEISALEGWFLLAMADMVDSNTKEWREPWSKLIRRFGLRNQWCLRRLAYRLRDYGWISMRSDGRGVVFTLHPDRGIPTLFRPRQIANRVSNQTANAVSKQIANSVGYQTAKPVAGLDRPPITPSGANARNRPSSGDAKGKSHVCGDNQGEGRGAHTPAVPEGKKPIPPVLEVPSFEPLDTRMVPRLRRRHADQVETILKSRLVAIDNHVLRNRGDSDLAGPASTAIREHLAAVKAWAVGIRTKQ